VNNIHTHKKALLGLLRSGMWCRVIW